MKKAKFYPFLFHDSLPKLRAFSLFVLIPFSGPIQLHQLDQKLNERGKKNENRIQRLLSLQSIAQEKKFGMWANKEERIRFGLTNSEEDEEISQFTPLNLYKTRNSKCFLFLNLNHVFFS